jgi:pyridoxamine 5'-phosphate oxidase
MEHDPIERFRASLSRAEEAGIDPPNAMALATVDPAGRPSVRIMLLKDVDENGFIFYTNLKSRKGRALADNPSAALCFWWPTLEEQVRVEGSVEPVDEAEAEAYFATRPRGSQLGARVSAQSDVLPSRDQLLKAFEDEGRRFEGRAVPRPAHWSGLRLRPKSIEFWRGNPDRLHERHMYTLRGTEWVMQELYP